MSTAEETVKSITYQFKLASGVEKEFTVRLRSPSMSLESVPREHYPEWTRLEFHQCPNCPLNAAQNPRCPVAVNLMDIMEFFKDCFSTDIAEITIVSEKREYRKKTPLPQGLSSLMGLTMTTSGCPILDKLRPMVYTHLPFAMLEETMYRAISMYLVAQFLLQKRGKTPDWDLQKLMGIYDEVKKVNRHFSERLRSINRQDAGINALIILDCLGDFTKLSIKKTYIKELETLFAPYLKD